MALSEGLNNNRARAEQDLRREIQAGLEVNAGYPNPDAMPWQKELTAVMQALDTADVDTLRQYARGWIAPGFPYRAAVEFYINRL